MANVFTPFLNIFRKKQQLTNKKLLESYWINCGKNTYMNHRIISDRDLFRAYVGHRADSDMYQVIKLIDRENDICYLLNNSNYYYRDSMYDLVKNLADCVYLNNCYTEPYSEEDQKQADNKVRELIHANVIFQTFLKLQGDTSVDMKYKSLDPYYERLIKRLKRT